MPKLAMLRISVYESNNNRMIGHRILPVETLRPGKYQSISGGRVGHFDVRHHVLASTCSNSGMTVVISIDVRDHVQVLRNSSVHG